MSRKCRITASAARSWRAAGSRARRIGAPAWALSLSQARHAIKLRRTMRQNLGYTPDLRNPTSFNERVAWKILHDRNPLIPKTTDKIAVRDFVAARIGADYLVPLLGTWSLAKDVPWDLLPDRFVAKASHGCGFNLIVQDKKSMCHAEAARIFDAWLARSYYHESGEWGYRDIVPRLLAEKLLEGRDGKIPEDYKLYVFSGQPCLLQVHFDRFGNHRYLWYDPHSLAPLPMGRTRHADLPGFAPCDAARALVPLASRLAGGFDAVRVDFYLVEGRPYFGELTHYPGGAVVPFGSPQEDYDVGRLWQAAEDALWR